MLRRTLLSSALTALAALTVAPAARAEMAKSVDRPVTITFHNYNLATASAGADATRELIAEFMAANPNIKVEGVPVASNDVITRINADIAVGRTPDVAQMVFRDIYYISRDLGANALEDMVPKAELAGLFDGMLPQGLELGRVEGKTYGLAYTFSTPILYYNATLFRAAGLDPDKPPRTWTEVDAAARAIVDKTKKFGFFPGMYGPADGTFVYQSILMSNGGKVRDGNRLTYADADGVEAVKMLRRMVDTGTHAKIDVTAPTDTMAAGNLGMFLYTSAVQASLLKAAAGKFELRVAPMPSFGEKATRPTNSGSALFVFSKDPVKQRASFELMKFLTSKHGYTIITSKIGYLPLRLDIVDDPQYLGEWSKANPLIRPNLAQLPRLTPNVAFPGPNYRQVEKIMIDAVNESIWGDGDPEAVLKAAQTRGQNLMPK